MWTSHKNNCRPRSAHASSGTDCRRASAGTRASCDVTREHRARPPRPSPIAPARALRLLTMCRRDGADVRPALPTDSGGGFLLYDEPPALPPRARPPPVPIQDPAERPNCRECNRRFPQSYLFDTFGYDVCDECRSVASASRPFGPLSSHSPLANDTFAAGTTTARTRS